MNDDTMALVLACGEDDGLDPLTRDRTKAAVPFGGEYRIIDFVLSNCLHSGLRRILVPTSSRAYSLQMHLRDGWNIFNTVLGQYVMPVGPQRRDGEGRFKGSLDAIAQNLNLLERGEADHLLILNGEHVYRMDYAALHRAHIEQQNDITVACVEAHRGNAANRLAVHADERGRVLAMARSGAVSGASSGEDPDPEGAEFVPAMDVALFRSQVLFEALSVTGDEVAGADVFRDLLPSLVDRCQIGVYRFGGEAGRVSRDRYWTDVATVDDYFDAHMGLLEPVPSIDLYQPSWQIWSYPGKNPPARTASSARGNEGIFVNSIVSNGTVIEGGAVSRSVLCPRVSVADSATVERSVLLSGVAIGAGAELRNCVIDKRVRVPPGVKIGFDRDFDQARFMVSEKGTVVVPERHDVWS